MKINKNRLLFSVILFTCLTSLQVTGNELENVFSNKLFVSQYSTINTIAGEGANSKKYTNAWKSKFEKIPAINAELSRPHHAISDSKGNIYIADKDAHAIRVIRPSGIIETVAGTNIDGFNGNNIPATESQLSFPNGIWITSNDVVYILDLGNNKIRRINSDGTITTIVSDPKGIYIGRGLWVSDDEQLIYYSSNHEVKKWTPETGIEVLSSGFKELGNIAVNSLNELYVTDRNAHLVYFISSSGKKTVKAGNGKWNGGEDGSLATEIGLNEVRGIWFHPNGGYFLATHKGGQIWFVDPNNTIHLFVDGGKNGQHSGDGEAFLSEGKKISEPRAISIDHNGNIIITENDAGFIRIIKHK